MEALPTPPEGRDIIASISLGERKGNWLVMMLFVWLLSTYQSKTPMLLQMQRVKGFDAHVVMRFGLFLGWGCQLLQGVSRLFLIISYCDVYFENNLTSKYFSTSFLKAKNNDDVAEIILGDVAEIRKRKRVGGKSLPFFLFSFCPSIGGFIILICLGPLMLLP